MFLQKEFNCKAWQYTLNNSLIILNTGEKYVPEDLWGGSDAVPSRRRGQEDLLL